jgi:hypothetical protein
MRRIGPKQYRARRGYWPIAWQKGVTAKVLPGHVIWRADTLAFPRHRHLTICCTQPVTHKTQIRHVVVND